MLARSITQCSHRPRLTTLSLLFQHQLRGPTWPRCCSSTIRLQSSFTSPSAKYQTPNPGDNDNDTEPSDPPTATTATTQLNPPSNLPAYPPILLNSKAAHHNLPTFLAHASRTSLSPSSSTYIGTTYEYTVQDTLRRFGFNLQRTGGRGDGGIDLVGTWKLSTLNSTPPPPQELRVLIQCKALKTKLGPNLIRELEGAFAGAPSGWRTAKIDFRSVIGVLVSPREATKGVREAMGRSRWPMVWVMLERGVGVGAGQGIVRQMLWNKAAREVGLEGLDVTMRYDQTLKGEEEVGKECVIMWHGRPVLGLDNGQQEAKS